MNATERSDDEVFEARLRVGLRELDGLEPAPDVSEAVLQRLTEPEQSARARVLPRLALAVALLAIAVTATLLVRQRGDAGGGIDGVVPVQEPKTSLPDGTNHQGAWRLVYEMSRDDLQRRLAEDRDARPDQLQAKLIEVLQKRIGDVAVVTGGDALTIEVKTASSAAGEVAAVRALLEDPGRFAIRAVADKDAPKDGMRFDMERERARLQEWLADGGRQRLRQDPGAIAAFRAESEHLRWFVRRIRPRADAPAAWDFRYVDIPGFAAMVAAHTDEDWNGGVVPAAIRQRPIEQQFLIELLAVNMHEVHFLDADVDPTSVQRSDAGGKGPVVFHRWRRGKDAEFADFSERYLRRYCAVLWNDEVLSVPMFVARIQGACSIPASSGAQADHIAKLLANPLPLGLRLLRSEAVAPR